MGVSAGGPLFVDGAVAISAAVRLRRIRTGIDPGIIFVVANREASEVDAARLLTSGETANEVTFFPGGQATGLCGQRREVKVSFTIGQGFQRGALPANAGSLHGPVVLTHLAGNGVWCFVFGVEGPDQTPKTKHQ